MNLTIYFGHKYVIESIIVKTHYSVANLSQPIIIIPNIIEMLCYSTKSKRLYRIIFLQNSFRYTSFLFFFEADIQVSLKLHPYNQSQDFIHKYIKIQWKKLSQLTFSLSGKP